ncbi:MAG TPA: MFS transporter [Planctomycetaceae bacterium]
MPDRSAVLRAVAWNQVLWTAGYSLTTGGFLLYFARELGANDGWIALLLVLPESVGVAGLMTRAAIRTFSGRKRLYLAATLLARLVALPVPLLAFRTSDASPLWWLVGCVAATHAVGAVAYVAYLSWLSDLMPERRWGRMFARREIAKLAVLLVVPVAAGYLRDVWSEHDGFVRHGYMATFLVGQALLAASVLPMLRLPGRTAVTRILPRTDWGQVRAALASRPTRFLLLHNWTLAFANGLTQSAFFLYSASFGPLGIGLGTYNLMSGLMRAVQIPVSAYAGAVCDRSGSLAPRAWGVLIGSSGLAFWLLAVRETWWLLFGAYLLWGAYAAANVAGDKLMVLYAPRSDNATQIALFAQVGGLMSGLAGLIGGVWLDGLREGGFGVTLDVPWPGYRFEGYQLVFAASLAGRYASVLWLWPLRRFAPALGFPLPGERGRG